MTGPRPTTGAAHDDVASAKLSGPSSPNPFAGSANITVSVPETVEIKLVDASALADYEVWTLLTSILWSAVIGFAVAFFQAASGSTQAHYAVATTIVFFVLMIGSGAMAVVKRSRISAKARRVRFAVGEPLPESD